MAAPSQQRASRILTQVGLMALAVATHKDATTLAFVTPIFLVATAAAARHNGSELDAVDVFWFLISLFFVVRPAQSLEHGSIAMRGGLSAFQYEPDVIILAFLSIYVFVFVLYILLPPSGGPRRSATIEIGKRSFALPSTLAFIATVLFSGGLGNVLAARYDRAMEQVSPLVAAGHGLLIAAAVMQVASLFPAHGRRPAAWVSQAVCLALLLVVFSPFSMSRFGLISAWLPIALIVFPILRQPGTFAVLSMAASLILMPILSITTRYGLDFETALRDSREVGSVFEIPYIDTFDSLVHGVYYAHTFGFQYGAKLVSILLCFVPRSFWPDKPIVSALDIGNHLHAMGLMGTPNLSMPIMGDFYMDFGLPGVLFGSVVVGLLIRGGLRAPPTVNGLPVVTYLIIGALPILMRGAVGAVIPLAACTLVSFLVLALTVRPRPLPDATGSALEPPQIAGVNGG